MIRYAGVYSGPSYGTYDPRDSYEAFSSLVEARNAYRERQETTGRYPLDSKRLVTDRSTGEVTGTEPESTVWPATSPEDMLKLYPVTRGTDGKLYVVMEPVTRFVTGPRGSIVREDYY